MRLIAAQPARLINLDWMRAETWPIEHSGSMRRIHRIEQPIQVMPQLFAQQNDRLSAAAPASSGHSSPGRCAP